MTTLRTLPTHVALTTDDDTATFLLLVERDCSNHGNVLGPVFEEVDSAGATGMHGRTFLCLDCTSELNWTVHPLTIGTEVQ